MNLAFVGFLPPGSPNPEERRFVGMLSAFFERTAVFPGIGVKGLTTRSLRSIPHRLTRRRLADGPRVERGLLPVLPIRTGIVSRLSTQLITRSLAGLTGGKVSDWVLWTRFPSPELVAAIRRMPFGHVVYEVVDNYAAEPSFNSDDRRRIQIAEAELVERATVLTASSGLMRKYEGAGSGCYWLPIGHDESLKPIVPAGLEGIDHPRLAVVGSLDELADEAILYEVAKSRRDWSLVLAGRRESWWGRSLKDLPNVFWMGPLEPAEARGVIAAADVVLNPCVLNDWTKDALPVKIFDYLAEGRPVVSTTMSQLDVFGGVVQQVEASQFVEVIDWALATDSAEAAAHRRDVAARFTQQDRARKAYELIAGTPVKELSQRLA